MIVSFRDKRTAALFLGIVPKGIGRDIAKAVQRKLAQIQASADIADLAVPPGNRLEQLKGDRSGQWSIRVNAQWRLCFRWHDGNALDVELVDYH
ncbi:MAG: type II toxin-antitoxin system RelE/ParE family toxin [Alphaproteobacteria bacterium]|nr:type II toxin-antitoxin system RelE/ParE family toxin [Alphaproteobacteria bacterium]MBU0797479.1 type II toxin-antitoxin system RelE/ParE family toxin [Alphaproteobacteria bacterium]MBU0889212.1 type II toxin-antitoxin system RelE/ParE family toxin [Alphaproteobacteria bacterium]MBU1813801.1 type II toxin-antitoxin system RelE/ParE family toxin [Alphaproteobacteria bacterium]MBU2091096.1 type II toxin-antitoxin system RelE/ParE family toxin [Alphaproteobacteria bacterium]